MVVFTETTGEAVTKQSCGPVFHPVSDPSLLMPILLERLPFSSMMHNQVVMHKRHKGDLMFYILGAEINSCTWIISNNIREDYGSHYGISAPLPISLGTEPIPKEVSEAFATSDVIDWTNHGGNSMSFFVQMPVTLANMIFEISTNLKGQVTEVHPCKLFTMDKEEALKLTDDLPGIHSNVQVRRLQATEKDANFILSTWKYTLPGSDKVVMKCLERNASAGVFVEEDKCVCGVYIPAMGLLSALYTLKEYRKKGYAKLAMKYAFKEYAKDACIPCLTVEIQNSRSIQFHESLGMKMASMPVNFLIVKKLEID